MLSESLRALKENLSLSLCPESQGDTSPDQDQTLAPHEDGLVTETGRIHCCAIESLSE